MRKLKEDRNKREREGRDGRRREGKRKIKRKECKCMNGKMRRENARSEWKSASGSRKRTAETEIPRWKVVDRSEACVCVGRGGTK